jgi:membrane protease YdiL (CAAX protease family)
VWLVSALILVNSDSGFPPFSMITGSVYMLLSLLTIGITSPLEDEPAALMQRLRLWLQVGLILAFIALTGWRGLMFHNVLPHHISVPLWSPLVDWLERLGDHWFGNGNIVVNPATYTVLPLALLLLAGARSSRLGFAHGHRVWRVIMLWCGFPVFYFAIMIIFGQLTPSQLARRFMSHFMQNGFFEEFLFRGALQTRLRRLWSSDWALVIQSLLFGLWHLGLGYTNTGHSGLLPAMASTIVNHAVIGLAFGIIFDRTRTLLAPSIVHIVGNSMG